MKKLWTSFAVLAVVIASPLTLGACGSDDGGGGDGGGGGGGAAGGEITIAQTSQPDYLDPALTYTVNGIEPLWLVYTPLLTYKHVEGPEGATLIPGLAKDLPEISADGLTYKLTLRKGLKYSDGTPVVASDFEHTIKRVLNLESGGLSFFEPIVGAPEYIEAGEAEGDIPGITTNNKTGEITIKLSKPYAAFNYVLAMWFGGLVPGDTPFENLTKTPPPGVGPYMITESVPNRQFVMEKNPEFAALRIPEIPVGNIDKITTLIVKNACKQAQDVINNELDFIQDPPCADLKPTVIEQHSDRYEEFATPSTYYMFMNTRVAPFDDPKVREAVNIGLDKPALARLFAGELTPGCTFLPPGAIGYDEALDVEDCPWGDPNAGGDLEKAQQMIEDAGAAGTAVTVYGNNDDPTDKVTQAYADQLTQMGFDAEPKILDGGVYFQVIGNEATEAQTGFANWFMDFPHPLNMYFLVDPDSIQPTNNQNFGNVDDPKIDKELDRLELETDVEAVTEDWAALDRYLIESGYIAAYGHRKIATFLSERMDFENCSVFHPVYFNDYSSFCLK